MSLASGIARSMTQSAIYGHGQCLGCSFFLASLFHVAEKNRRTSTWKHCPSLRARERAPTRNVSRSISETPYGTKLWSDDAGCRLVRCRQIETLEVDQTSFGNLANIIVNLTRGVTLQCARRTIFVTTLSTS